VTTAVNASKPLTSEVVTKRGCYYLQDGFAYVTLIGSDWAHECYYIHPAADEKELNYYCQDPGCCTALELTLTRLYDGWGLVGAKPI